MRYNANSARYECAVIVATMLTCAEVAVWLGSIASQPLLTIAGSPGGV